ncbi:MAG: integrase core domain-containing protein [Verrucomicrobiia bacterium]
MNEITALLLHLLLRSANFFKRRGARALLAENLLLKHQLQVLHRSRRRAPNLHAFDRLLFGFWTSFLSPRRLLRAAVILEPSTLLRIHRLLRDFKCRFLFCSRPRRKPGPKGPDQELIEAICEFKRRNPRFGCPRIAQHLAKTFGLEINKDLVRRVLARHYRPGRRDSGPSWLTFLGHAKDSLWSLDLFRTESILLKSHWVLVIMDQFSRRIIGFGVQAVAVDGVALCRMFNQAISGQSLPARLRVDHDPLFQFQRSQANLRILGIEVVQTVPLAPWSHPFVERLIRSVREEYLDQLFYWNASDLEQKLAEYRSYFNERRVHQGLGGNTPAEKAGGWTQSVADLAHYGWQRHCHDLVQLPIAA